MANAWNELTWSLGNYGEQNNATVIVGSVSASSSVGEFSIETEQIVIPDSLNLTAVADSPNVDILNNGWGARTWGFSVWGSVGDIVLTGQQLSTATGDLTASISIDVDVNGISAQSNVGDFDVSIDNEVVVETAGLLSSSTGTVDFSITADVPVDGISLSPNVGNTEAFNTTGWGRLTWGAADWGEGADEIVTVNGQALTIGEGLANVTPFTDVIVVAEGLSLSTVIGNEDAFTDVDVVVDGQSLSTEIGDESVVIDVTFDITGIGATFVIDQAEGGLNTPVDVTGVSLSTDIGQVITFDSVARPEGVSLTTAINQTSITAWSEVDTGTEVTWTDVDLAA